MIPLSDVEDGCRLFLRASGVVGQNVFFGIPSTPPPTFVTVSRIGGGPEVGKDAGLDVARISLPCWGTTKKEASDLALAVGGVFGAIEGEQLSPTCFAYGANVDMILWQPAPDTGRPRYIVDITITARATVPASP